MKKQYQGVVKEECLDADDKEFIWTRLTIDGIRLDTILEDLQGKEVLVTVEVLDKLVLPNKKAK